MSNDELAWNTTRNIEDTSILSISRRSSVVSAPVTQLETFGTEPAQKRKDPVSHDMIGRSDTKPIYKSGENLLNQAITEELDPDLVIPSGLLNYKDVYTNSASDLIGIDHLPYLPPPRSRSPDAAKSRRLSFRGTGVRQLVGEIQRKRRMSEGAPCVTTDVLKAYKAIPNASPNYAMGLPSSDPLAIQIWKLYHYSQIPLPNQKRMENFSWRMMSLDMKRKQCQNSLGGDLTKEKQRNVRHGREKTKRRARLQRDHGSEGCAKDAPIEFVDEDHPRLSNTDFKSLPSSPNKSGGNSLRPSSNESVRITHLENSLIRLRWRCVS